MPRGENENSKKALEANRGRFNAVTAVEANRKSQEAKAWKATVREAIQLKITPEEVAEIIIKMARKHNIKALDMILEITGEKAAAKVIVSNVSIEESAREIEEYFRELEEAEANRNNAE